MIKMLFSDTSRLAQNDSARLATGLLLLRLIVGVALISHGFGKIQTPFDWMGPDAPVPGILQFLAALSEFGGGLALIVGLLVPLASLGILVTMAVAVNYHVSKGDAFVGGWELAAVYFVAAVFFLLVGAGRYSLDDLIRPKLK